MLTLGPGERTHALFTAGSRGAPQHCPGFRLILTVSVKMWDLQQFFFCRLWYYVVLRTPVSGTRQVQGIKWQNTRYLHEGVGREKTQDVVKYDTTEPPGRDAAAVRRRWPTDGPNRGPGGLSGPQARCRVLWQKVGRGPLLFVISLCSNRRNVGGGRVGGPTFQ